MSEKNENSKMLNHATIITQKNEDLFYFFMPIGCSLGTAYDACIDNAQKIANIIQNQLQKAEEERKKNAATEVKQEEIDKGEVVKNIGD